MQYEQKHNTEVLQTTTALAFVYVTVIDNDTAFTH